MEDFRVPLLSFEKALMVDTFHDDCLFIFANGLDVERLFLSHLYFYSEPDATVFVIHTEQDDDHYFFGCLKELSVKCSPKLLTADVSTKERALLYNTGGIQFVTSRILMVDLLSDRVPVGKVSGILVYRAHGILESFQESFILRLFREKCRGGFVKAFTDEAAKVARAGLGQLQRLMNRLYVRRVVLLPRFDADVKACFEACKPKFSQVSIDLPPNQKKIRNCLAEIISACMRDLKQCSQGILNVDSDSGGFCEGLSAAAALKESNFEVDLRRKTLLLNERQERLLSDLNILRVLLHKIEDLDVASAWHYICRIRSDKNVLDKNSGWLFTSTATTIFSIVEQLCFTKTADGETSSISIPPKWTGFISILEDLSRKSVELTSTDLSQSPILVLAANAQTCYQLMDLVKLGQELFSWKLTESILGAKRPKGFTSSRAKPAPQASPLWNPDNVMFYDAQALEKERDELMNCVREEQKKTGKEAKKRSAKKIIDPKIVVDPNQPKLVNFGIIRYAEKKAERRAKRRPFLQRKTDEKSDGNEVGKSQEVVPEGMHPEDPFTNYYTQATTSKNSSQQAENFANDEHCENADNGEDLNVNIEGVDGVGFDVGGEEDEEVQVLRQIKTKKTTTLISVEKIKVEADEETDPNYSEQNRPSRKLIFMALGNRYNLLSCLERYRPAQILLYNVDIVSNRIIETFQAHNKEHQLELYSLMYTDTTEEERYLVALQREQLAFEALIREQGVLMMPTEYDVTRDTVSQLSHVISLQKDSRRNRRDMDEPVERKMVVVDMREFNSELPTVLYRRGIDVSATTLEVGDYVLSPQICVERKALDDLTQSLNGGRIFKQSEQMIRYYDKSILLIESNEKFRQRKVNGGPFQGELSRRSREIRLLLTMLIRACPQLALLWSFSPAQSAELFEELTLDQPNPSVNAASAIHSDDFGLANKDDEHENLENETPPLNDNEKINDDYGDDYECGTSSTEKRSQRVDLARNACDEWTDSAKEKPGEKRRRTTGTLKINAVLRRSLLNLPGLLSGDVERLMKCSAVTTKRSSNGVSSSARDDDDTDEDDNDDEEAPENLVQLMQTSAAKLGEILQNRVRARELIDWFNIDFRLVSML